MRIENFRAIRKTSLGFDDGTVLIVQNDCGISSVLDVLERARGSMGVMNSRAGMTAILPISSASISVEVKSNQVHPRVNGKDMFFRSNRTAFLQAWTHWAMRRPSFSASALNPSNSKPITIRP